MQQVQGLESTLAEGFDRSVYDGLAALLGAGPVGGMARRFGVDLQSRFAGASPDALRRDAHAVTSSAGMLGFVELSLAARTLERACVAGADLAPPLVAVLAARDEASRCLAELVPDGP